MGQNVIFTFLRYLAFTFERQAATYGYATLEALEIINYTRNMWRQEGWYHHTTARLNSPLAV